MKTIFEIFQTFVLPVLLFALWATPVVLAQESLLDDKVFKGRYQENHIRTLKEEQLKFVDGELHSMAFAPMGFGKGVYTAVVKKDGIHFEAVTVSPNQGTIDWRGIVNGDSITVNYKWRKKGWFTDTVRGYSFNGTIVK